MTNLTLDIPPRLQRIVLVTLVATLMYLTLYDSTPPVSPPLPPRPVALRALQEKTMDAQQLKDPDAPPASLDPQIVPLKKGEVLHDVNDLETQRGLIEEGLWLVEFYSPRCGHCIAFKPTMKRLAEMVNADINVATFDVFENGLYSAWNVSGTPTLRIFRDGQALDTFSTGSRELPNLINWVYQFATRAEL